MEGETITRYLEAAKELENVYVEENGRAGGEGGGDGSGGEHGSVLYDSGVMNLRMAISCYENLLFNNDLPPWKLHVYPWVTHLKTHLQTLRQRLITAILRSRSSESVADRCVCIRTPMAETLSPPTDPMFTLQVNCPADFPARSCAGFCEDERKELKKMCSHHGCECVDFNATSLPQHCAEDSLFDPYDHRTGNQVNCNMQGAGILSAVTFALPKLSLAEKHVLCALLLLRSDADRQITVAADSGILITGFPKKSDPWQILTPTLPWTPFEDWTAWITVWESLSTLPSILAPSTLPFSVIIPCYECAQHIERTLPSVSLALEYFYKKLQTIRPYEAVKSNNWPKGEVLVVLDGCSLAQEAMVKAAVEQMHLKWLGLFVQFTKGSVGSATEPIVQWKIVRGEGRGGPGNSRNLGIENSKGDVIMFLDAGDQFEEAHIYWSYTSVSIGSRFHYHTVNTRLQFDSATPVHPYWHLSLSQSHIQTFSTSRFALNYVGGFVTHPDQMVIGGETSLFLMKIKYFFPFGLLLFDNSTVTIQRTPGNEIDRKLIQYQSRPLPQSPSQAMLNENIEITKGLVRKWETAPDHGLGVMEGDVEVDVE